jgi:hypothetical protein
VRAILGILIIIPLAGFAPREFCAGFGRGYTVGYQRASGNLPAAPPACPVQLSSHRRESGYLIGLVYGIEKGRREWAFADHMRGW